MRLVVSALVFSLFLSAIALNTYIYNNYTSLSHLRNLIFVIAGGSIGGFFSISLGINKIICEKDVANWLYILYGVERIIIATSASTIVYFAIQADLVFSITKKLPQPLIGFIFFAIVAGFSETFVPNLLIKIEKEK